MTKKVKKTKKNGIADENSVDEKVEVVAEEIENVDEENLGTPSYEELLDKKEDLEQALLRANADLEHALSNLSDNASDEDKEGIELTLKSFESTLDKFGMIPIYPVNEEFNPEKHEAVSMEKDKNKKDGEIGNIFQRGWELHSRVIRPARVTVIKN